MNKLYKLFKLDAKKDRLQLGLILSVIIMAAVIIAFVSPIKVLGLLAAIILLAIAVWRPLWAVFLLAVYIPFEPFLLKFVPDEIYVFVRYFSELMIYVMILRLLAGKFFKGVKFKKTPLDWPFILFFTTALASMVLNFVPLAEGLLGLRMLIRFILVFYLMAYLRPSKKFIKILITALLLIVFFQALLGGLQTFVGYSLDNLLLPSQEKIFR